MPENAVFFVSMLDFCSYCKIFSIENIPLEIEGEPDSFPCFGFPVYTFYEYGRKDKRVFAFVYPRLSDDDKKALFAKSEWEPLDKFEAAMTR